MDVLQVMRAFSCVVQAGSLTGAAERLGTTTTSISRMLSNLEAHLHIRLLNRTTRRIALTEAGKRYLTRCQQILELVETAESEVQQQQRLPVGQLRIHASHGLGQRYVVDLITRYRQRHPAVTFNLTMSNRLPDLEEGYDMSILLRDMPPQLSCSVEALGSVQTVLCASPTYLARMGQPHRVQDLSGHACLASCDSERQAQEWLLHGPTGLVRVPLTKPPLRVDSEEALCSAIVAGLGIGLLPAYASAEGLRTGTLQQVLPAYRSAPMGIYAVSPGGRQPDARTSTWIRHLQDYLPGLVTRDVEALCA
ncbi:LysR family transcriptional regulator [Pseudomonas defluvii]|uniref:LysR family transcriptional regulator n=1 Tax=Pseudomonas defluvii TaxID=1876757 RepID=UPI0039069988